MGDGGGGGGGGGRLNGPVAGRPDSERPTGRGRVPDAAGRSRRADLRRRSCGGGPGRQACGKPVGSVRVRRGCVSRRPDSDDC
jgi:hypothetical protein